MSWVPRFEIQRWVGRRWPFDADGWTTGTYTVPAPAAVTTPKARTLTLSKTFLMLETPKTTDVKAKRVLVRQHTRQTFGHSTRDCRLCNPGLSSRQSRVEPRRSGCGPH